MSTSRLRARLQHLAHLRRGAWPGPIHLVDTAYAAVSGWKFEGGWGDETVLSRFEGTEGFDANLRPLAPVFGDWQPTAHGRVFRDGTFASPVGEGLPEKVALGRVRHLRHPQVRRRATAVLLAGSGEEGYDLRTGIHGPLVDQGIELWMLESPFYGARRAPGQRSADVARVSDQARLNLGMVAEGAGLALGLREQDDAPLAVGGYSMGAYMAVQIAMRLPFDVGVAALAGGDSARDVYGLGLLSLSIDFARLGNGDAAGARDRLGAFYHRTRASLAAPPRRPDAAVIVAARGDGYVPLNEARALQAHWPGSALREIDGGHISAVLTSRRVLRAALSEAIARVEQRAG